MSEPIAISDRMPTKEERERPILWFHDYALEWFPGEFHCYDGKYIRIAMRHWYQEESLYEFTHWMFAPDEPARASEKEG